MSRVAASSAAKAFRLSQFRQHPENLARFGPLPATTSSAQQTSSSTSRLINPFVAQYNAKTGRWAPPAISLRRQADLVKKAKKEGWAHLLPPGPKSAYAPLLTQQAKSSVVEAVKEGQNADLDLDADTSAASGSKVELPTSQYTAAAAPPAGITAEISSTNAEVTNAVEPEVPTWAEPVEWLGKVTLRASALPGAENGARLYMHKKKMFKGHRWERLKVMRESKRKVLLRDMDKRIQRYKTFYARKRPDPLKPASSLKSRKLPF